MRQCLLPPAQQQVEGCVQVHYAHVILLRGPFSCCGHRLQQLALVQQQDICMNNTQGLLQHRRQGMQSALLQCEPAAAGRWRAAHPLKRTLQQADQPVIFLNSCDARSRPQKVTGQSSSSCSNVPGSAEVTCCKHTAVVSTGLVQSPGQHHQLPAWQRLSSSQALFLTP